MRLRRTAGRRDSETHIPPLQLVAFSISACMDRAIVCCLAQGKRVVTKRSCLQVKKGVETGPGDKDNACNGKHKDSVRKETNAVSGMRVTIVHKKL